MHRQLWASILALGVSAGPCQTRAETLWIPAGQATSLSGPIVLGQKTGLVEEGALGDFLVSALCVRPPNLDAGYAEYRVRIPRPGPWYVWARLRGPLGQAGSFAWIPQGESPRADASRAFTISEPGARQWRWEPLGARATSASCPPPTPVSLPQGTLSFRIYARQASDSVFQPGNWRMARPMFNPRLNLLCLTTQADYVPSDADAQRATKLQPTRLSGEAVVKPAPLPPVSADEWKCRGKQPIPDWLRCPRFYTKDTWRSELAGRKPGDIAFMVRQIAANEGSAFRLSAFWSGEAYFQSQVAPHAPGLGAIDYLREALDEGRRLGVTIVMYMNPNALYREHPLYHEAAVRRADGSESEGPAYGVPGTHYVCINNPKYREFLRRLLTEVFTKYGPAGLYVDGLTPHRCFCPHCREKYRGMWGQPMPVEKLSKAPDWCVIWEMVYRPDPVGDPTDPDTPRYTAFLARSLAEATRLVSETVKRAKPGAATLFHSWPKPQTIDCYDGTLTEIYLSHPWVHRLWKFGELANYSNVFAVPTLFNIYLHDHGTEAEARTKMIQGLANGCYPNCWNELGMKPMFRFMRENAEYLDFARTTPVRFLAFVRGVTHDAAQERVIRQTPPNLRPPSDMFLAPYVGCYSALVRSGIPVVTLPRADFHKRLDGFKVLVLANEACMSDEQVEAVRRFVRAGGGLIATYETSRYDEKGNTRADFGLADVFGCHFERTLPPEKRQLVPSPEAAPFAARKKTLSDLSRALAREPHVAVRLDGSTALGEWRGEPSMAKPTAAAIWHEFGSGRVIFVPSRWDALECDRPSDEAERLLDAALEHVSFHRLPVEVVAGRHVGVTLFEQPNRWILHLVSLDGDTKYATDRVKPLKDGSLWWLRVPAGSRVQRLHRLWAKAEVPFEVVSEVPFGGKGDRVEASLGSIGEYEVLVAEFTPAPGKP
jgi:hypothetical protein